jgi:chromosome segregation ATPase
MQQTTSTSALLHATHTGCIGLCQSCGLAYARRPARLVLLIGLAMIVLATLVATASQPAPAVLQAKRLEVVDDAGNVRFAAYTTGKGGRVEVRNDAGEIVFSVGLPEDEQELPGVWERLRLDVEQQHRDMTRQEQALTALTRRVQEVERQQQSVRRADQREQEVDRRLRDLEQQRRTLDMLERQIDQLSREVDRLERR